jgi:ATPase family associated with various cellular activities (AAA)
MILSPQQHAVLNEMMPVARIATDGSRTGLPLVPRCHALLIGPSGSGKSYLAKEIARSIGLPCLTINVATWILTASRNEPSTWTQIVGWLSSLTSGGVIVIDEVDKCNGPAEYTQSVRLEIHDLLDGVIPIAAKVPEPLPDFLGSNPGELVLHERDGLARILRERVMVIGCGAWQSAWTTNTRTLGFTNGRTTLPEPPSASQITGSIDPELRQRFRDQVYFLPPMIPEDYAVVAHTIAAKIPQEFRRHWQIQLGATIRKAVAGNLGMRALEELLLTAMILTKKPISQARSEDTSTRAPLSKGM